MLGALNLYNIGSVSKAIDLMEGSFKTENNYIMLYANPYVKSNYATLIW